MVKAGENSPASFIFLVYSYDGINVKKQFFTLTNQISVGLGEALAQGVLQVPANWDLSSEARRLQESGLPGLCPGPRGLALWFPGGQRASRKEKSDAKAPPSRKPGMALGSLLSVALSSLPVKHCYDSTDRGLL